MKRLFLGRKLQICFAVIGAVGGFLYWKLVGCNSGTCVVKSVWYWSTLWGVVVGYLVGDFIDEILKKRKKRKEQPGDRKISKHN